mmetsp:Transcript_5911/g.20381  ORF Transcript_5911/g.20381 Transcript_5911/m.20381 type:complete len:418 (+) Transcript_5911:922-2175(+)
MRPALRLSSAWGPKVGAELDEVCKNSSRRHIGPGTRAGHHERLRVVPLRPDEHDVVGPAELGKGVGCGKVPELHAPLARGHVHGAHVSQHLTSARRLLLKPGHLAIKLGQPPHELLARLAGLQLLGHEAAHRDVRKLELQPALPRQVCHLPRHVGARKVVPRVGLRVAAGLCLGHDLAEPGSRLKVVEEVRERAGEDALHARDPVARVHEALDRGDHGQPCTHRGFVKVVHLPVLLQGPDGLVALQRARVHLLVRCNHVHATLHPDLVKVRNVVARTTVHDDGHHWVLAGQQVVSKPNQVGRVGRLVENLLPIGKVYRAIGQKHLSRVRDPQNAHVDPTGLPQHREVVTHLVQQSFAHQTRTYETQREFNVVVFRSHGVRHRGGRRGKGQVLLLRGGVSRARTRPQSKPPRDREERH